jgi:hypothetical protein
MNKPILNVLFILAICFVAYLLFRNLNINLKEGMTSDPSGNIISNSSSSSTTSSSNGIAGSAQNYAANIKSMVIQNQDILLISKYRTDYENAILNLDDLINTLMLQTALTVNPSNPSTSLEKLVQLNSARSALNSIMKFIDSST